MTTFANNVIPIEKTHYTCISAIDSVLKIDKEAFPQAYLEQSKYKLKKKNAQDILIILKLLIMIVMIVIAVIVKMIMKMKLKLKVKMKISQCLLIMKKYKYFE